MFEYHPFIGIVSISFLYYRLYQGNVCPCLKFYHKFQVDIFQLAGNISIGHLYLRFRFFYKDAKQLIHSTHCYHRHHGNCRHRVFLDSIEMCQNFQRISVILATNSPIFVHIAIFFCI